METDVWRWADPAGQQRVVRLDELRAALASGVVPPNAPVWRPGWRQWQPAREVPELTTSALSAANGVVPNIPPPPLAVVAVQHAFEAKAGESFRPPPVEEDVARPDEPPPPPRYVPEAVKPNSLTSGAFAAIQAPAVAPSPASAAPKALPTVPTVHGAPAVLPAPASAAPPTASLPSRETDATPIVPSAETGGAPSTEATPAVPIAFDPARASTPSGEAPVGGSAPPFPLAPSAMPPPATTGMGAVLPTTVGLPPPPSLAALAAAASAGQAPNPTPMVEEMSGSLLLDEPAADPFAGGGPLPPPTDPIRRPEFLSLPEGEEASPPSHRSPLKSLVRDFGEVSAGRAPKNKRLAVVTAVFMAAVGIVVFAVLVTAARAIFGGKSKPPPAPSVAVVPSAPPVVPPPSPPTASAEAVVPPPDPPKPAEPSMGDCTAAAEAKSLGFRAVVGVGVETAIQSGGIAVAFATSARDGVALTVDPTALTPGPLAKGRGYGADAKRVSGALLGGKLAAVVDNDKKGDRLAGRRLVATATPIDIGTADNAIVWAPHAKDTWAKLFSLEGEGVVDALRAVPYANGKGIAFVFRRGAALYVGAAKGEATLEPQGTLAKIESLGQAGSPSIAASGDAFVVAWADRASQADAWQVRFTSFAPGQAPAAPKALTLPEGGIGGQAMSPSLAGLGAGKVLLAWMEGPASNHQIRAQVLGADGAPSGAPIAVSPTGMNAGNPSVAVGADGKAIVAFLGAKKNAYEVYVTPVTCAAK